MVNEPPRNVVEMSGKAAESVINGLKAQPSILAIVVLNLLAVGAGVWFMTKVVESSQRNMQAILQSCFHNKAQL
jgi:hypothetical protein